MIGSAIEFLEMLWKNVTQEIFSSVLVTVGCLFFGRLLWAIYLYPLYFSPYLGLPQAKVRVYAKKEKRRIRKIRVFRNMNECY